MLRTRLERMRGVVVGAGLSMLLALTGCGAFFQCEGKTSCGSSGGGSGSGSGDYVYVSNVPNNPTAISGYQISTTGTLTALPNSPYTISEEPVAMSITPDNKFLYIASQATPLTQGIYVYTIGSNGAPAAANNGSLMGSLGVISSMAIAPDGDWLYTIEEQGTGAYVIQEYSINTSTGVLTPTTNAAPLPGSTSCAILGTPTSPATSPCMVQVAPSGNFVIATTSGTGAVAYPRANGTSGGLQSLNDTAQINSLTNGGYLSVGVDANNFVYIGQVNALSSYAFTSGGAVNGNFISDPQWQNSETPRSIAITSGGFIYTADQGNSTISGFSSTAGALTSLGEVSGPTAVSAIGVDNTGKYLVAAGFSGSFGVQLFSISSTGTLSNLNQNQVTGVADSNVTVLALTH